MKGTEPSDGQGTMSDRNKIVRDFLLERVPIFAHLEDLRKKGWENPHGDVFFKDQRRRADEANDEAKRRFFNMMRQIGAEMDKATGAISQLCRENESLKVLDLCMAPGGFSNSVIDVHPITEICGISLPRSQGGHKLLLNLFDPRIRVEFTDITMLAAEMGVTDIPPDHPDAANFRQSRPYLDEEFDLVICDGQVLRTHPRAEYRSDPFRVESLRLTLSQLIFMMQRIKPGGTVIILLHHLDTWDNLKLLHTFSKFAHLQLFKPRKKHAIRSSFYLVAKGVDPHCPDALRALETWKEAWSSATFRFCREDASEDTEETLSRFGEEYIRLGQPIWTTQANALRKAAFVNWR